MQKGKLNTKKKKKYSFVKCSRNSLSRRIIEWTRVKQSREDDRLSNVHSDWQAIRCHFNFKPTIYH